MQEDRARIYDAYDKKHGKGVYAPCDNPDSDDFYLTPAEKRKAIAEKLKAEGGGSALTRNREAVKRIYAHPDEPAPEVAPDDGREPAHQAVDSFLEKNPRFTKEADWKMLRKTALESMHDDVIALRKKAEKTGSAADIERLFARSAEVTEFEKVQADRRAVAEKMAQQRHDARGF